MLTRLNLWLLQLSLITSCHQNNGTGEVSLEKPEATRFTRVVLEENLDEPIMFEFVENDRLLIAERKGKIRVLNLATNQMHVIADIPVSVGYYDEAGEELQPTGEDGLLGVVLDPDFTQNHWIYIYYSPAGGKHRSILTRYEWKENKIDMSTEKILLEVPNQRKSCCHLGGGMLFDSEGNLYITTGDNSAGAHDERPGSIGDAHRTSANTNDLRGKILRIHPEPDGSYTIPEGNLFPKDLPETRPEIYTMGNRNPWRLSIDSETGWLYWGEVGPGGIEDISGVGPRSYDEFNQARKAGNYGWPQFSGNNQAYWRRDYASGKSLEKYDSLKPKNLSSNNTGLTDLPPPQPAFIWYPQTDSKEFPLLGSGSNSAVGGPIYHFSDFKDPKRPFPSYYEGKWFITDWVRGWIMVVSVGENGDFESMERFLPELKLTGPIDLKFGSDGDLYVLEYGRKPYEYSPEARIVKIEYNNGNRRPIASMSANKKAGAVPLRVNLSSSGTKDYDNDNLTYKWKIISKEKTPQILSDANPEVTFSEPGRYNVSLVVRDSEGAMDSSSLEIFAGNDPPNVQFNFQNVNKSFFFVGDTIQYSVNVSDKEDGSLGEGQIAPSEVGVSVDYFNADGSFPDIESTLTNIDARTPVLTIMGNVLMNQSDCYVCHKVEAKSVGPAFIEIAKKYQKLDTALNYLKKRIISGGAGVWGGDTEMPPHLTLTDDVVSTIARYILNLKDNQEWVKSLPVNGKYVVNIPQGEDYSNFGGFGPSYSDKFVFRASYIDQGTDVAPSISVVDILTLRNPTMPVIEANKIEGLERTDAINPNLSTVSPVRSGSYLKFDKIDLTKIRWIEFDASISTDTTGWLVEIRTDSPTSKLIGKTGEIVKGHPIRANVDAVAGIHDLYFVFIHESENDKKSRLQIRAIKFIRQQLDLISERKY